MVTMRKNLKLVVVALVVLAIEKTIDTVASLFAGNDIHSYPNVTIDRHSHSPAM